MEIEKPSVDSPKITNFYPEMDEIEKEIINFLLEINSEQLQKNQTTFIDMEYLTGKNSLQSTSFLIYGEWVQEKFDNAVPDKLVLRILLSN